MLVYIIMHQKIRDQIIEAMRDRDSLRLEVLRGLQALFSNELIAQKSSAPLLKDADVMAIIKKSVKQRKDSIEQFEKGGRKDLVKKEKAEMTILEEFLPAAMSRADIKKVVQKKIKELGKDKAKGGQFMGMIMKELKGQADGGDVKAVIDELTK